MSENNVIELHIKCMKCKREIPEGYPYYKHPKLGIICSFCPEFAEGGISMKEDEDEV